MQRAGKRGTNAFFKALQENFTELIERHFPILRCRLEEVLLQMDKAYWVEDPHFSANYHISRVALPKPQNWRGSLSSVWRIPRPAPRSRQAAVAGHGGGRP